MKTLYHFINDTTRRYKYKMKFADIEITKELQEKINRILGKYLVVDMSKPSRSIRQMNPIDFTNINNAEVYSIDFTTSQPISSFMLLADLSGSLKIPEKFIVVRGENDPLELQSNQEVAKNDRLSNDEPTKPVLLMPNYDEYGVTPNQYGTDYAEKVTIAKLLKDREVIDGNLQKRPLFYWLDDAKPAQLDQNIDPNVDPNNGVNLHQPSTNYPTMKGSKK